jgi:hypothetical protein
VSQRNGASSRVDVVASEAEDLGIGFDDGGEGLVEFPDSNVLLFQAGLFEKLFNAGCWGDGEVDGI